MLKWRKYFVDLSSLNHSSYEAKNTQGQSKPAIKPCRVPYAFNTQHAIGLPKTKKDLNSSWHRTPFPAQTVDETLSTRMWKLKFCSLSSKSVR
jgi:hypothetical protein